MKFYKSRIKSLFPFYPNDYELYLCCGLKVTGCGNTPTEAYDHWINILQKDHLIKFYFVKFNLWLTRFNKTLEI